MRSCLTLFCLFLISNLPASADSFRTVVIDAGHGGRDFGGSYGKVYEKWLALDTAMRVERKLKAEGFRTIMTRRSDKFISLPERVRIANSHPNSIFVSIHYNFTWKRDVSGLETFYTSGRSRSLSNAVQKGMLGEVKSVDRGSKHARYYVIRHARNPAILVEGGFVSNSKERSRTKEGWYREAIADGIVKGILEYKNLRRQGKVH